jgi:hypothetical protein
MGLLDDAIREHLDLKRRRGADPTEVEQAEREALGPVRRKGEQDDLPETETPADAPDSFAYDHAEDEDWTHDSLPGPAPGAVQDEFMAPDEFPPGAAPAKAPADFAAGTRPEPSAAEPHRSESQPSENPPSDRSVSDMGGGETMEYSVEDALSAEDDAPAGSEPHEDDDDVLEETPEFLQDTPDHDRLWFEQRPPKDFDFDG